MKPFRGNNQSFKNSIGENNITINTIDHLSYLAKKKMLELLNSHGDKFNVNRFIDEYIASFEPNFLNKLKEGGRWLDAGAGNLKAIKDFLNSLFSGVALSSE